MGLTTQDMCTTRYIFCFSVPVLYSSTCKGAFNHEVFIMNPLADRIRRVCIYSATHIPLLKLKSFCVWIATNIVKISLSHYSIFFFGNIPLLFSWEFGRSFFVFLFWCQSFYWWISWIFSYCSLILFYTNQSPVTLSIIE